MKHRLELHFQKRTKLCSVCIFFQDFTEFAIAFDTSDDFEGKNYQSRDNGNGNGTSASNLQEKPLGARWAFSVFVLSKI